MLRTRLDAIETRLRRPATPQQVQPRWDRRGGFRRKQLAEIREAAKRGPGGKPLEELRHDQGDGNGAGASGRLGRCKLGRLKAMADFDWAWPKRIDRAAVESAVQLDFLEEGRNVVGQVPLSV